MTEIFCTRCGTRMPDGASVYPSCHNPIQPYGTDAPQQTARTAPHTAYQNRYGQAPVAPGNGNNGNNGNKTLLIVVIVALIAVMVLLAVLVLQRCTGRENTPAVPAVMVATADKANKPDTVVKEVVVVEEKTADETAEHVSAPLQSGTIQAYDGFLNIRSRPNARSRIVDVYYNGNTIYYRRNGGSSWVKVYDSTGTRMIGYANRNYIY